MMETCAICGALPCDQAANNRQDRLSSAITLLFTHGIISGSERDSARRRLSKAVSA
jgi:hypothetical protein